MRLLIKAVNRLNLAEIITSNYKIQYIYLIFKELFLTIVLVRISILKAKIAVKNLQRFFEGNLKGF